MSRLIVHGEFSNQTQPGPVGKTGLPWNAPMMKPSVKRFTGVQVWQYASPVDTNEPDRTIQN